MGEIAEMMLDGTMCEQCGEFMGGECGFARLCAGCAKDAKAAGNKVRGTGLGGFQNLGPRQEPQKPKVKCQTCGKKVKHNGLADHIRDAHGPGAQGGDLLDLLLRKEASATLHDPDHNPSKE